MPGKAISHVDSVFGVLVHYAPNGLTLDTFRRRLPNLTDEEILNRLGELEAKGLVRRRERKNDFLGEARTNFELARPLDYPMRRTIRVGAHDFRRNMHGDPAGAEDLNEPLEALSEYIEDLEKRFVDVTNQQTKRYWGNTITLFGLFMAVFTIILSTIPSIEIDASWTLDRILWTNLAAAVPHFAILMLFVLLLWWVFRRE